ncbi:MAG: hypothetical protein PWQ55_173 [Chloroflexota bacterium]|nr:hypothetical protein [Chloroflexota bacterium]
MPTLLTVLAPLLVLLAFWLGAGVAQGEPLKTMLGFSVADHPDPVKIQGCYIMYFGPLFLITAFGVFGKKLELKHKLVSLAGMLALSVAAVGFACTVLDGSSIYPMDQPLGRSVNSPYSSLMLTMKALYPVLGLAITAASLLLLGQKRSLQAGLFPLFILAFNIYGSVLIHQRQLTPRQLLNTQIHNLMGTFDEFCVANPDTAIVTLDIPEDSTSRVIRSWHQVLNFNGYTLNEIIPSAQISADERPLFRASYGDCRIDIQHVDEADYAALDGVKFDLSGYYYQIFVQHFD